MTITRLASIEKFPVPGREPDKGFYWYFQDASDATPVVVEVNDRGEVMFCGQEAFLYLPSTGSSEYVINGLFVGPITHPSI